MAARRCKDPRCGAFAPTDSDWCKRHRPISEALATVEEAGQQGAAAVGVVKDVADAAIRRYDTGSVLPSGKSVYTNLTDATVKVEEQAAASPAEVERLQDLILDLAPPPLAEAQRAEFITRYSVEDEAFWDEALPHHADQVAPQHRKPRLRTRLWHHITRR